MALKKNTSDPIADLLDRGTVDVISRDDLEKKLRSGKKLRVKLGIDPTGAKLHIGRAIPLWKLRAFQDLGHQIVLIIGDFTGLIGDTSDKDSERPMLTHEQVRENMRTYAEQFGVILDMKKVELRYNSEWLGRLDFHEISKLADLFSVAEMVQRETVARRLKAEKRVSLREFLYPLMQGYDSVAVKADVEIGGSDQRFNLLAGREIQRAYGQAPQNIMTFELLEGFDGRKMSTSYGNTVSLTDAPEEQYGRIMSMSDDLIIRYFSLCTRVPLSEIQAIEQSMKSGSNPRDSKMRLAREIISLYHSADDAVRAEAAFVKQFQKGELPDEIPLVTVKAGEWKLAELAVEAGLDISRANVRRLTDQGGVKVNGTVVREHDARVTVGDGELILQIGKRKFARIKGK